jgi:shikimate dehydrogenase
LRLALLGDPVHHSLSPLIHTAALRAAGIAGRYEAHRVDAAGFDVAVAELRRGELDGANVTMPHKVRARDAADVLDASAARASAVNTLVMKGSVLHGHNTDVTGLRRVWAEADLPSTAPVLVLGAGGAAAAALVAFEGRGIVVSARREEAGQAVVDRTGVEARVVPWGVPEPGAVVINATPVGMAGDALPGTVLSGGCGLVDLAYGADPTPAIVRARRLGIPAVDGVQVLLAQGAAAFEIWVGFAPTMAAMRAAVPGLRP